VALVKPVSGQPIHRLPDLTMVYRQANLFNAGAAGWLTPEAVRLMQASTHFNPPGIGELATDTMNRRFGPHDQRVAKE